LYIDVCKCFVEIYSNYTFFYKQLSCLESQICQIRNFETQIASKAKQLDAQPKIGDAYKKMCNWDTWRH